MFLYRDVIQKSLKITWQHKYLWFFGLFAAFLGGFGSYSLTFLRVGNDVSNNFFITLVTFIKMGILEGRFFVNMQNLFSKDPIEGIIFLIFFIILTMLCLFLFWLAIISQIAIVNNASKIIKAGKKQLVTTIQEGVNMGVKKFWLVVLLNIIVISVIYCIFALVNIPLLSPASDLSFLYYAIFVIVIPIAQIIFLLLIYSICFLVIKEENIFNAITNSWKLFINNWLVSLEVVFILFFVELLFIVALIIISMAIGIPLFFAYMFALSISSESFLIFLILGISIFLVSMLAVFSALTSFKLIVWVDMFVNLVDKKRGVSKLIRLFHPNRK